MGKKHQHKHGNDCSCLITFEELSSKCDSGSKCGYGASWTNGTTRHFISYPKDVARKQHGNENQKSENDKIRETLENIISNPEMCMAFLKFVQEYAKSMNYPCSTSGNPDRELHRTSVGDCKSRNVTVRANNTLKLMRDMQCQ